METKELGKMTKWMESTDLEEITWKNGGEKISIKLNNYPQTGQILAHSALIPVISPSIGIFHFSKPGKSNAVKEGMHVKKGRELGFVETAGDFKPVASPENGFIKIIPVKDGKAVEYGLPLFFIEPG